MTLIEFLTPISGGYDLEIFVKDVDENLSKYYEGTVAQFFDKYDDGDIDDFISMSKVLDYMDEGYKLIVIV